MHVCFQSALGCGAQDWLPGLFPAMRTGLYPVCTFSQVTSVPGAEVVGTLSLHEQMLVWWSRDSVGDVGSV